VAHIASVVTELVLNDLRTMNGFNPKENYANANRKGKNRRLQLESRKDPDRG
jgi:hypothetical protein